MDRRLALRPSSRIPAGRGVVLLLALSLVAGCGDRGTPEPGFLPEFVHVPPSIRPPGPEAVVPDAETGHVVVKSEVMLVLAKGKGRADLEADLAAAGIPASVVGEVPDFRVVQVEVPGAADAALRGRMRALAAVAGVSPNLVFELTRDLDDAMLRDDDEVNDWGLRAIRVAEAWDRTLGEGVTVAVIDDGIDVAHKDLQGAVVGGWSYRTRSATQSLESFQGPERQEQEGSHGTHVAGTIAARGDNREGTAGVAPGARVLTYQVFYRMRATDGSPDFIGCSSAEILDAVSRAMAEGAQVMNLSLGPRYDLATQAALDDPGLREETVRRILSGRDQGVEYYEAVFREAAARGLVLVVSAGNNRRPADWCPFPAMPWTVSVGAIGRDGKTPDFTNYEDGQGDRSVDLCAPGAEVWSLQALGEYLPMDGTSMAAPHVSGAVALLKSLRPSASFEEILDVLVSTAEPVTTAVDVGPRLDVAAAVREMLTRRDDRRPPPPRRPVPPPREPPTVPPGRTPPGTPPPPTPPPGPPALPPGFTWQPTPPTIVIVFEMGPVRGGWVFDLVRFLVDAFLRSAVPLEGGRFDEFGRVVDFPRRVAIGPPPDLGGRDRFRYVWDRRDRLRSRNLGTLEQNILREVDATMRGVAVLPPTRPGPRPRTAPVGPPAPPPATPRPVAPPPVPPPAPPVPPPPTPGTPPETPPRGQDGHVEAPPPMTPPPSKEEGGRGTPVHDPALLGVWHVHSDYTGGNLSGLPPEYVRDGLDWSIELKASPQGLGGTFQDHGHDRHAGTLRVVQVESGTLRFEKVYPGWVVAYEGSFDPAAQEIRGTWRLPESNGVFVMRRTPREPFTGAWNVHSDYVGGNLAGLPPEYVRDGLDWTLELRQQGSVVTGTFKDTGHQKEAGLVRAGRVEAGGLLKFEKVYGDRVVTYEGRMDAASGEVRGTYVIPGPTGNHGTFVMRRAGARAGTAPPAGGAQAGSLDALLAGTTRVAVVTNRDLARVMEQVPTRVVVITEDDAESRRVASDLLAAALPQGFGGIVAPIGTNGELARIVGADRLPAVLLYEKGGLVKRSDGDAGLLRDRAAFDRWLHQRKN